MAHLAPGPMPMTVAKCQKLQDFDPSKSHGCNKIPSKLLKPMPSEITPMHAVFHWFLLLPFIKV